MIEELRRLPDPPGTWLLGVRGHAKRRHLFLSRRSKSLCCNVDRATMYDHCYKRYILGTYYLYFNQNIHLSKRRYYTSNKKTYREYRREWQINYRNFIFRSYLWLFNEIKDKKSKTNFFSSLYCPLLRWMGEKEKETLTFSIYNFILSTFGRMGENVFTFFLKRMNNKVLPEKYLTFLRK